MGFGSRGSKQIRDDHKRKMALKKKKFKPILGGNVEVKKEKYDHIILKPEVFKEIGERLQMERRRILKRQIIIFVIILVSLIGLLLL